MGLYLILLNHLIFTGCFLWCLGYEIRDGGKKESKSVHYISLGFLTILLVAIIYIQVPEVKATFQDLQGEQVTRTGTMLGTLSMHSRSGARHGLANTYVRVMNEQGKELLFRVPMWKWMRIDACQDVINTYETKAGKRVPVKITYYPGTKTMVQVTFL
jgi:hypothetical protein